MLKKIIRKIRPNPLDCMIKKLAKKNKKKVLLAWNRGLGDIALGLYAIVERIYTIIPDADITFLIRKNLEQGFSLLENINVLVAKDWQRNEDYNVIKSLEDLNIDPKKYDLIIEKPDPTYWVKWQLGKVIPKLKWQKKYDALHKNFDLPQSGCFIGVQPHAETNYGLWRNWPYHRFNEFFDCLEKKKDVYVLLFGMQKDEKFLQKCVIDLRGETDLFSLLSIIKNRCSYLLTPDSGILSMTYYLDENFFIKVLSLWAEKNHGILKQNVKSPNLQLTHIPIMAQDKNLENVAIEKVLEHLDLPN